VSRGQGGQVILAEFVDINCNEKMGVKNV